MMKLILMIFVVVGFFFLARKIFQKSDVKTERQKRHCRFPVDREDGVRFYSSSSENNSSRRSKRSKGSRNQKDGVSYPYDDLTHQAHMMGMYDEHARSHASTRSSSYHDTHFDDDSSKSSSHSSGSSYGGDSGYSGSSCSSDSSSSSSDSSSF